MEAPIASVHTLCSAAIAIPRNQWDNASMRKLLIRSITTLAAGLLLVGNAHAQQTPAATTPTTPAAQAPKAPAAKTGQAAKPRTAVPLTLKTEKDKFSYALGMNLGSGLHKQSVDVDPAIFLRGLKDGLAAGKTLLTEQEAQATLVQMQNDLRKKAQEKMQQVAVSNKQTGDAFLASNKAQDGVVTLPSGLQYRILKEGTGPKPAATDSVVCNYRGTLLDGTEFDSSYKRGQPATFQVNGVIKGWTEALQLMPVGSKWQLVIPSDLAYGERGAGQQIGPNSTLIFEVELLSIQPKAAATTPAPTAETPH
jgi:FKBP-type peptidyl-prolyl cis-trans isomerase FklB